MSQAVLANLPARVGRRSGWHVLVVRRSRARVRLRRGLRPEESLLDSERRGPPLGARSDHVPGRTITGLHFTFERGAGFVSDSRYLVIAPACAGVNFLVIAFSLSFGFVPELETKARKIAFVSAGALSAYVAMVVVNALRISLHVLLTAHVRFAEPIREQAHRVEGVVTYLTALSNFGRAARACFRGARR